MTDPVPLSAHSRDETVRQVWPDGSWRYVVYRAGKEPEIHDEWPPYEPAVPVRDVLMGVEFFEWQPEFCDAPEPKITRDKDGYISISY